MVLSPWSYLITPTYLRGRERFEINRRGKSLSFQMPSCNHCMCISIRCDRQHIIAVPVCVFSYMHGSSSVWPWAVEIPWMRGRPCKATHSHQAFNDTHQWSNQRAVTPQLHMRALWILSELKWVESCDRSANSGDIRVYRNSSRMVSQKKKP